jgi:hypothetical protein
MADLRFARTTVVREIGVRGFIPIGGVMARPPLMKLITTFPLERYDIPAFGQRARPGTSEAQSYYDRLQDLENNRGRARGSALARGKTPRMKIESALARKLHLDQTVA